MSGGRRGLLAIAIAASAAASTGGCTWDWNGLRRPADAGAEPGACGDPDAGILFCSGFETGDLGEWETFIPATADIGVSSETPFAGSYSARANGGDAGTAWLRQRFEPVAEGEVHGQLRLRIASSSGASPPSTLLVRVSRSAGWGDGIALRLMSDGRMRIVRNDEGGPADGVNAPSDIVLPRDEWLCIGWTIVIGSSGVLDLRIDDRVVAHLAPIDTVTEYAYLEVGIVADGVGMSVEVDDVRVSRRPLRCD